MQIPRSHRLRPALVLTALATLCLSGCGKDSSLARTFGIVRDAPDEFTVTTRAPLSMPPDFSLRPPRPGAARPMEDSERRQAEQALVPQTALNTAPAGVSPGQEALLQAAGPPVSSDVRQQVDEDTRMMEASPSFVDRLLFWRRTPVAGVEVDPQKEAKRLRENAALGQSNDMGDTPIIQPHRKGWLEDLF